MEQHLQIDIESLPKEEKIQFRKLEAKIDALPMKKQYQLYTRIAARKNESQFKLERKIESLPMKKNFQLKARLSNQSYQTVKNDHLKPKLKPLTLECQGSEEFQDSPLVVHQVLEITESSKREELQNKEFASFFNGVRKQKLSMSLSEWKDCSWRTWTDEDFIEAYLAVEDYMEERKQNLDLEISSPMELKGLRGSAKRKLVDAFEIAKEPKKCRKNLFCHRRAPLPPLKPLEKKNLSCHQRAPLPPLKPLEN